MNTYQEESIGWKIFDWSLLGAGVIIIGILMAQGLMLGAKGVAYLAGSVADRSAEAECIQWANEAAHRSAYSESNPGGYFLTKWQKEECDSVNINVNAPVL